MGAANNVRERAFAFQRLVNQASEALYCGDQGFRSCRQLTGCRTIVQQSAFLSPLVCVRHERFARTCTGCLRPEGCRALNTATFRGGRVAGEALAERWVW